jgi:pentapeptide repeat protein
MEKRRQKIRKLWKDYRFQLYILGAIILMLIGVLIGFGIFASPNDRSSYCINLFTSVFSIAATVLIVDQIIKKRNQQSEKRIAIGRLIRELRKGTSETATLALEELKENQWLYDGSLKMANLHWAKGLFVLDFTYANLRQADLGGADLTNATFWHSKLENSIFGSATLNGTNFGGANLKDADFTNAVVNQETVFNGDTILPDGNRYQPDLGLDQFTPFREPNAPNFWRSDNPNSPAYPRKQ